MDGGGRPISQCAKDAPRRGEPQPMASNLPDPPQRDQTEQIALTYLNASLGAIARSWPGDDHTSASRTMRQSDFAPVIDLIAEPGADRRPKRSDFLDADQRRAGTPLISV